MEVTALGTIQPEALSEIAKPVAVAGRDVASFSLAGDDAIPQAGLCLSFQAVARAAGQMGGLDTLDIVHAYASAFASFVINQSDDPALRAQLLTSFNGAAMGAFKAMRRRPGSGAVQP